MAFRQKHQHLDRFFGPAPTGAIVNPQLEASIDTGRHLATQKHQISGIY